MVTQEKDVFNLSNILPAMVNLSNLILTISVLE
nr:MAG TPA: hypothetical protein [Caudoviricetes sp.]